MKRAQRFAWIETNGVTLRTVVEGAGPLIVLLHGFPQCWYLWRHQIDPLAAAGFRVAVPDQRGYGASSRPEAIEDYDIRTLCADVRGLARALGYDEFIVVGHDWGCIVAWNTALLHEDACRAVMGLSVPSWRFGPATIDPPGMDERFWYIRWFQKPGLAETTLERDVRRSLYAIYYAVSADAPTGSFVRQLAYPRTASLPAVLPEPPARLPSWLTTADLDYYAEQYTLSGFRGPVNWYRNIPMHNARTPELDGKPIAQPAAFAAGACDPVLDFDPDWRAKLDAGLGDARFVELVEDAGHWLQMEQPDATTRLILRFLDSL